MGLARSGPHQASPGLPTRLEGTIDGGATLAYVQLEYLRQGVPKATDRLRANEGVPNAFQVKRPTALSAGTPD